MTWRLTAAFLITLATVMLHRYVGWATHVADAASYYWIGNGVNWNTNAWASTSGGASNASQPGAGDDVIFDANSPGNCTLTASTAVRSVDCQGGGASNFTHTLTHSAVVTLTVGTTTSNGGLCFRLSPTMTYTRSSVTTSALLFASLGSGQTEQITTAGKTLSNVTFNSGGVQTWQLQDALTANGNTNTTLTLTSGTLDLNGKYVKLAKFASTNSNTRRLDFNGSTMELLATTGNAWNTTTTTALTLNATNGTIYINTVGVGVVFIGGGLTYGALNVAGSAISLTGSNTFGAVTGGAETITFATGSNTTFASYTSTGPGTAWTGNTGYTVTCATGVQFTNGIALSNSVSNCTAAGGTPFYAGANCTVTNSTGWLKLSGPGTPIVRPQAVAAAASF